MSNSDFVIARSEATKQSRLLLRRQYGLLRSARNDDGETHLHIPAARKARVMHHSPPSAIGGRRECRVPLHPRASRAANAQETHTSHLQVQPNTLRHSLRDGLRLIRGLLGVPGLLASVASPIIRSEA